MYVYKNLMDGFWVLILFLYNNYVSNTDSNEPLCVGLNRRWLVMTLMQLLPPHSSCWHKAWTSLMDNHFNAWKSVWAWKKDILGHDVKFMIDTVQKVWMIMHGIRKVQIKIQNERHWGKWLVTTKGGTR